MVKKLQKLQVWTVLDGRIPYYASSCPLGLTMVRVYTYNNGHRTITLQVRVQVVERAPVPEDEMYLRVRALYLPYPGFPEYIRLSLTLPPPPTLSGLEAVISVRYAGEGV